MARIISTAAQTVLAGQAVPMCVLVDLLFPGSPDYFACGAWDVTVNGNTYLAGGQIIEINPVTDSPGDPRGISLTVNGVPSANLALALQDSTTIQGVPVNLYSCVLDPTTYQPLVTSLEWSGRLDTLGVDDGEMGGETRVTLTAEHIGIDLIRPQPVRWTDVDQRRLFSSDPSLEFIAATAASPIVWPAASFFKIT